jgi:hypothetical protein
MRRLLALALATGGAGAAFLATGAFGHYVSHVSYFCDHLHLTVEQFPLGPSPVTVSVFKNGAAAYVGTGTVTADQSGHGELDVAADLTGDSLIETTVAWSVAGGGSASYADHLITVCETKTVTVTTETPVTAPAVTVERQTLITTPGATTTLTLPAKTTVVRTPAKHLVRTVVRRLPPRMRTVVRTVVRWRTRTVVKIVRPKPVTVTTRVANPTPCVVAPDGRCGFGADG